MTSVGRLTCGLLLLTSAARAEVVVAPAKVELADSRSRQQLLVTEQSADGFRLDHTRAASYESADAAVAQVDARGIVRPRRQGATTIRVKAAGQTVAVPVIVGNLIKSGDVSYLNEVMAVLGKSGCNSGACHGHNSGKGGFKLSLRGYHPAADLAALTERIDRDDPDQSRLLLKATLKEAHRGGKRFDADSDSYALMRQWIAAGAKSDQSKAVALKRIEVLPDAVIQARPGLQQQLVVRAHFADGSSRDVTDQAIYELSHEGVVEVAANGLVTGKREGETAVFVRFLGQMGLSRFLVVNHRTDFAWSDPGVNNFIDEHVNAKLRAIQVLPSALTDDAAFLRRVSLDVVGLPPTADEVRTFLSDSSSDKRRRKIDELLDREEFGEVWSAYWLELSGTTATGDSAGPKNLTMLSLWLRDAINRNLPYDRFVRELVASKGSSLHNPAVAFSANRLARVEVVPQLFLGIRLECAQCHDHPFDVWKQADYQALGVFFADLTQKEGPLDTHSRELRTFMPPERLLPWERTKTVTLRHLDGQAVEVPRWRDRREVLVEWLLGPAKRQTARALVNRVWGKLLGRGIVEPVDDMRFSNPPVNEPLLAALADDFLANRYNFKRLVRTILQSRTYQRSSIPNATNERETMNFSHARLRRLSAEQLLDALSQATGIEEDSRVGLRGGRAMQLPWSYTGSRFLTMFGRPEQRMSPCECIRSHELTLPQILHLLNGDTLSKKLGDEKGSLRRLVKLHNDDGKLIEALYLTALSRSPTVRESTLGKRYLVESAQRIEGAEDLFWALLSSQEFFFNH